MKFIITFTLLVFLTAVSSECVTGTWKFQKIIEGNRSEVTCFVETVSFHPDPYNSSECVSNFTYFGPKQKQSGCIPSFVNSADYFELMASDNEFVVDIGDNHIVDIGQSKDNTSIMMRYWGLSDGEAFLEEESNGMVLLCEALLVEEKNSTEKMRVFGDEGCGWCVIEILKKYLQF